MNSKPVIAITMGDPAGVGPEIAIKAFDSGMIHQICCPLLVGHAEVMRTAAKRLASNSTIRSVTNVSEARFKSGEIEVVEKESENNYACETGTISASAGHSAYAAITTAIDLAKSGQVDAIVTNPIHKKALNLAGHDFAGHTEILAKFTGARNVGMLMAHGNLRIIHVSGHVSLLEACKLVKKERILQMIVLLHDACLKLGVKSPRIGVAGLNPHAGDHGLFGTEEADEIAPAVLLAGEKGWQVDGPVPPDTLFAKAAGGFYDGVVAMYHDQGLIPFKLQTFRYDKDRQIEEIRGVNITLGLPIVRTSVAHGTAFDIAGKGCASAVSLLEAIDYACRLSGKNDK